MGARRAGPRRRAAARRAGAGGRRPPRGGGARLLTGERGLLIREVPATELTLATRILAHLRRLPSGGHVALRVGADVVYLGGRHVAPEIMTPYDVAAVRLGDGLVLAGDAPEAAGRYLDALRGGAAAAAPGPDGAMATAVALGPLVEQLTGLRWEEALDRARALGGLVGAYPAETGPPE